MRESGFGSIPERACTSSAPNRETARLQFLRLALSGEAGLLLLAWGLSRWLQVAPLSYLRPSWAALLWGLAATLPLVLVLIWMLNSAWSPIRRLVALVVEQLGALLGGQSPAALAALAAVAGLSEEVLFRGVIQPGLTRWVSPGVALIVTSLLFGLVHSVSRAYALFAAIMGCYLGLLFQLAGNLFVPIVAHAAYDFVALVWVAGQYRRRTV